MRCVIDDLDQGMQIKAILSDVIPRILVSARTGLLHKLSCQSLVSPYDGIGMHLSRSKEVDWVRRLCLYPLNPDYRAHPY